MRLALSNEALNTNWIGRAAGDLRQPRGDRQRELGRFDHARAGDDQQRLPGSTAMGDRSVAGFSGMIGYLDVSVFARSMPLARSGGANERQPIGQDLDLQRQHPARIAVELVTDWYDRPRSARRVAGGHSPTVGQTACRPVQGKSNSAIRSTANRDETCTLPVFRRCPAPGRKLQAGRIARQIDHKRPASHRRHATKASRPPPLAGSTSVAAPPTVSQRPHRLGRTAMAARQHGAQSSRSATPDIRNYGSTRIGLR